MDFSNFGIDAGIVLAIIAIVKGATTMDKAKKLKRFYWLFPLPLALAVAYFKTDPFVLNTFGLNVVLYGGASVWAYSARKTVSKKEGA